MDKIKAALRKRAEISSAAEKLRRAEDVKVSNAARSNAKQKYANDLELIKYMDKHPEETEAIIRSEAERFHLRKAKETKKVEVVSPVRPPARRGYRTPGMPADESHGELTLKELQDLARQRGLKTRGNKDVIRARIIAAETATMPDLDTGKS